MESVREEAFKDVKSLPLDLTTLHPDPIFLTNTHKITHTIYADFLFSFFFFFNAEKRKLGGWGITKLVLKLELKPATLGSRTRRRFFAWTDLLVLANPRIVQAIRQMSCC